MSEIISNRLEEILTKYHHAFSKKVYREENDDADILMALFSITPELKRENRQYWGRELGMCWQLLLTQIFQATRDDFVPALRFGKDEPCDFGFSTFAVDTKYRIGSGDSGTLKKFKSYGVLLKENGYQPVMLILRNDNLAAAMTACAAGGWQVYSADETFAFILQHSGFDLKEYLNQKAGHFGIQR